MKRMQVNEDLLVVEDVCGKTVPEVVALVSGFL